MMDEKKLAAIDARAFAKLRRIAPNILANRRAAREGRAEVRSLPEEVAFKLTNRCDLRCTHCYQWSDAGYHHQLAAAEKNGDLDIAIVRKVLAATRPINSNVYLWGGEPLLYRDWDTLVALVTEDPRWMSICTNGTWIDRRLEDLCNLSDHLEVSISLDGFAEEHDAVRGAGAFARTVSGLRLLLARRRANHYRGEITVNFLITGPMIGRMVDFVTWLEAEGVDTVFVSLPWFLSATAAERMDDYFRQHIGWEPTFPRPSWHCYDYGLSASLIDELANAVDALRMRRGSIKLRFNPDLPAEDLAEFVTGSDRPAQGKRRCNSICSRMDVFPDGQVVSCKFFPEFRVGSLVEGQVAAVWHGTRFTHIRETMARCGLMPVCAKCNLLYTRGG